MLDMIPEVRARTIPAEPWTRSAGVSRTAEACSWEILRAIRRFHARQIGRSWRELTRKSGTAIALWATVMRIASRLLAFGAGAAAGGYATLAALAWSRYGRSRQSEGHERDELLEAFMPAYDVVERHCIRVEAPAAVTLAAAGEQDLFHLPLARIICKTRELVLGATPDDSHPRGLLAAVRSLGWGTLAEVPDREIVMGAVTKPWEANVTFRALPPREFTSFSEPGFVKIAWTLRADPVDDETSIFLTETRAVATDASARARFRRYWAFVSPGIALIRRVSLRPLKREAERRVRSSRRSGASS
jgi:hypothetical protein